LRLLTEKDYIVLSKVFDSKTEKGFSRATASTIEDIENRIGENNKMSQSKIRDALRTLVEYEYIDKGIKKVRKDTFFVTAKGINDLTQINVRTVNITKGSVEK
jgi:hypothetical protein